MKKICFVTSKIESTGGTERVSIMLSNKLIEQGYEVYFFNLIGGSNPIFEVSPKIKIETMNLPLNSTRKNFLKIVFELRNFLKKNKIDVVVDVDSILSVFSTLACIGIDIKHICWEHFNFNEDLGVIFRRLGRMLAANFADTVVTLTERDKQIWQEKLKNLKAEIVAIPNPTPYENIENTPLQEYKTVLAIGRLTYQKGFNYLIDAWSIVCKENKDWKLQIIGDGEDEIALKDQARSLGIYERIEFIPSNNRIDEYYKKASFFCMSSRFEGLPMVLLEAQAYGLPIVSFDCDTGPSEVIDNNFNGILVPCYEYQNLAEKMNELIKMDANKYKIMSKNASDRIKRFDIENIKFEWNKVLESS